MKQFYQILRSEGLIDDLDPATAESFARISNELERQDELMHEIQAKLAEFQELINKMGVRNAS